MRFHTRNTIDDILWALSEATTNLPLSAAFVVEQKLLDDPAWLGPVVDQLVGEGHLREDVLEDVETIRRARRG